MLKKEVKGLYWQGLYALMEVLHWTKCDFAWKLFLIGAYLYQLPISLLKSTNKRIHNKRKNYIFSGRTKLKVSNYYHPYVYQQQEMASAKNNWALGNGE